MYFANGDRVRFDPGFVSRFDYLVGQKATVIDNFDLEATFRLFPYAIQFENGDVIGVFSNEIVPA